MATEEVVCGMDAAGVWHATRYPRVPTWEPDGPIPARCIATLPQTVSLVGREPTCPHCMAIVADERRKVELLWALRSRVCTPEEMAEVEQRGIQLFGEFHPRSIYQHDIDKEQQPRHDRLNALLLQQFKIRCAAERSAQPQVFAPQIQLFVDSQGNLGCSPEAARSILAMHARGLVQCADNELELLRVKAGVR